jgi:hypothetical protein
MYRQLKRKPYWGNHLWAKGYCVDTVGLDETKIRAYVQYQEKLERLAEQKDCTRLGCRNRDLCNNAIQIGNKEVCYGFFCQHKRAECLF